MKNRYNRKSKLGGANNNAPNNNGPPPGNNPPDAGNNPPANNAPPGGNNNAPPAPAPANNAPANNPSNVTNASNNSSSNSPGNSNSSNKRKSLSNISMNNVSTAVNSAGESVRQMVSNAKGYAGNKANKVRAETGKLNFSSVNKYLIILFIAIIFILLIVFAKYLVVKYSSYVDTSPYLIKGTKSAKHSVVINQDPESINYIQIRRSENKDGMEFTYSFWMLIMDINYKRGDWKHVFHKGNNTSYPNRAPGVWIHPTKNSLRVYMNTFDNILEYVDVDDIPVKKWFCVQLVLQNINSQSDEAKDIIAQDNNHVIDVYVNGQLKKSKLLNSVPKQNNGDLWVNLFGGYDGYLSKLRYYAEAVDENTIENIVKEGPASVITSDTGEMPPYLNDSWWFNK